MKTLLVIPDIHHRIKAAEKAISKYGDQVDEIIFTGDYFDDFGDNANISIETAEWLLDSMQQPKRVHLWGNHDIGYFFSGGNYCCSGWDFSKQLAISKAISIEETEPLKFHYETEGFLFSHAGLHPKKQDVFYSNEKIRQMMLDGEFPSILDISKYRNGWAEIGGITWQDWREFIPIKGKRQIVGHTEVGPPELKTMFKAGRYKYITLDNFGVAFDLKPYDTFNIKLDYGGKVFAILTQDEITTLKYEDL